MPGRTARAFLAVALVASFGAALARPADAQQLDAKKAQAAALAAKISAQGNQLDIADEAYNQAQIAATKVSSDAASAKTLADAAEARYRVLKGRLGERARLLYMNPSAPIDVYLGSKTFSQLERGQVLGASVLTADAALVMRTEKARQEVLSRAHELDRLQSEATTRADQLNGRRNAVAAELSAQRSLLANVKGDIANLIAQQQAEQLAQAKQALQQETQTTTPSKPLLSSNSSKDSKQSDATDGTPAPPPPVSAGAAKALAVARAQIGKPYQWAAAGPDSFDCSGLTMYAWGAAGVSMVHSAAAQYDEFPHVSQAELQPGDLVFFGSPIHHVGIYEGGGIMIDAPQTGELVRRDSIARADYAGASRP
jgi:cell wall-associated NlpC family hydrolase